MSATCEGSGLRARVLDLMNLDGLCPACGQYAPTRDGLLVEHDDDDDDVAGHEREHSAERRGGPVVDRRVCQGIGCPYGDH